MKKPVLVVTKKQGQRTQTREVIPPGRTGGPRKPEIRQNRERHEAEKLFKPLQARGQTDGARKDFTSAPNQTPRVTQPCEYKVPVTDKEFHREARATIMRMPRGLVTA